MERKGVARQKFDRNPDLCLVIFPPSDPSSPVAVHINNGPVEKFPSLNDIIVINEDLYRSANKLVERIKGRDSKRDSLKEKLLDISDGLAICGNSAFNKIIPSWVAKKISENHKEVASIEIHSNNSFVPWEWLFIDSVSKLDKDIDIHSLVNKFLGHKFIIYKEPLLEYKPMKDRTQKEYINIGIIFDQRSNEKKDKEEIEKLRGQKFKITLLDMSLIDAPMDKLIQINKFLNHKEIDIFHFACKSTYEPKNPRNSKLVFPDFEYSLRNLEIEPKVSLDSQFVFLNACSTGLGNPEHIYDFANYLIREGASAVIALQAEVKSDIAAYFAKQFYENLLSQKNLGTSLFNARMKTFNNFSVDERIVTLFYTAYRRFYSQLL